MTLTMTATSLRCPATVAAAAGLLLLAGIGTAAAQPLRQRAQAATPAQAGDPGTDPAELGRLFDAYTVMQAQEALGLDDARFGPFVTRLRALQQLRRRHLRERAVLMREMRRLLQAPGNDGPLQEKLDALVRLETTIRADEATARAALDDILDVRQRARFRLLEQQLELRKLELVNRARARQRATPR
jgi:hypothetical protein